MVIVENLVKYYGRRLALDHVSFRIEKRGVVGLLGPNGAGKSTTMNILASNIGYDTGSVTIAGFNLRTHEKDTKKNIGYLPELPPLYPEMTVMEYLLYACGLKGIKRADSNREALRVADGLRIMDVKDRLIQNLSKGYRQRVGIAQALIGNPGIIILDEPFIGLDPRQITEVRGIINTLRENHAVVFSSHILSEVTAVCDRVIVLSSGRVVADGTVESLTAEGKSLESVFLELTGGAVETFRIEADDKC